MPDPRPRFLRSSLAPPLALLLALSLTPTLRAPAHAAAGDIEISLTSEALTLVSDTVAATTSDRVTFTPGLRAGYAPIDQLTVLVGWRSLVGLARSDRGYDLRTSGDALVLGARWSFDLHPIVDLHAELELEAMHTDFALDIAGHRAASSDWGFGLIPKAVASVRADLDWIVLDTRLFVGFALRSNLRADDLRLASRAPRSQVAPLDLGATNLSGLVFGLNLALVF